MKKVEFRVLGPLEVRVEGRALELNRRKQRALLALLLLHAGEVVSTDRLIDDLWAGNPPKAAVGSLQNLISSVRKELGRDIVQTRSPGYVLEAAPGQVDLHRFEQLVAQASTTDDAGRRVKLLREALGLWRGPPLADLAFEAFAGVEIARLEELRTAVREDLVDAELELGHHSQLVPELEALVSEHPLRERLRGQLMLALYRSGRQAEALEAYRQARETLVDELGIEPSAELQQLEHAILRHDEVLDLPTRVSTRLAEHERDRRKTVTVLFTDVVDSTGLSAALDAEVMRAVMSRYFDSVRTIVERHEGTVEKFIGDAAMAVFGIPQQHEDDAMRAVRAAAELGDAITALNTELERDHGVAIQIRTAINTGEVVAGDSSSGQPFATGGAINVAMKLHEAALPAEILLGSTTHNLVQHAAATEPVEPIELGGSLGTIAAYRLASVSETSGLRSSGHAVFVGRQDELARLRSAFDETRAEKRSRVLAILGEAGIGKSRLVRELAASLKEEARFVVGRCLSYGEGATFLPLAEIVRQVAPQRRRVTITSLLAGEEDAELVATRLTELTGDVDVGASSGEVFWAARRLFEALARERPLVVVLDDVHWAEPTLLDFVDYLTAWRVDSPLLIVCLARPELREERSRLGDADVLRLEPLADAVAGELVQELGGPEVDAAARDRIVAVAEGNPLFLEQLLAFLEEAGTEALDVVPPTVEALLASRVDRLEPEDRALLERAAVVGREFVRAAVVHLTPPEELAALDERLRDVTARGLIEARRDSSDSLRFHHILIRDVVYSGITKETRSVLHKRLATWLEARSEPPDEIVGYHLEQAHRYRAELHPGDPELKTLAAQAGDRLAAAGIHAWKRADTPAAINLLTRATSLLSEDSPARSELLCELGVAQGTAGDFAGAETTLLDARDRAAAVGDRRTSLRAQIELAHFRLFTDPEGASSELTELATQAIPIFEELAEDRALGRTWRQVGYVRSIEGRLGDWQAAVERALVHYRRSGWSAAGCLADLSSALFYGPTPVSEALRRCEQLLEEATDHTGQAHVLAFTGGLEAIDGRFEPARLHVGEAAKIYEELGEVYARANYSGRVLGRIEMLDGDAAAAARALEECCATFERMHDDAGLSTVAAEVADALYAEGRFAEAETWLELAEKRAASEDVSAQWSWRRTRAKLLAREGAFEAAEVVAGEAVRLAARTDALSDRGLVLLDLAEVLRIADRPDEAAVRVEEALALFERKGNRVSAETARTTLSRLAVARP